jgi:ParB family chromosome partitioning protein
MATDDFLKCLSKSAIEKVATAEGVRVEVRGKDTRARVAERFKSGRYVHPAAGFSLTEAELARDRDPLDRRFVPGAGLDDEGADPNANADDGDDEPSDTADAFEHRDLPVAAE